MGINRMNPKEKIMYEIEEILGEATDEELSVIEQVFKGLREKKNGEYDTYIMSFMQSSIEGREHGLTMKIPIHPILSNSINIVHGGLTATLADTAMGTLVKQRLEVDQVPVTSEMKINYTAPGKGKHLTCHATILHLGSKTAVTEAKIFDDSDVLVAVATGSFFIIPRT